MGTQHQSYAVRLWRCGTWPSMEHRRSARPATQHQSYAVRLSAGIVLIELLMATVRNGPAWHTSMERAAALRALRRGIGGTLPDDLSKNPLVEGWLRRLLTRMLAWDAAA